MPKKIKVGILTNKTGAHVGAYLTRCVTQRHVNLWCWPIRMGTG